jgi:hypothetical protein
MKMPIKYKPNNFHKVGMPANSPEHHALLRYGNKLGER